MGDFRLISADSHFVEPPTMWAERVDRKFRDRAPHTVKGLSGREGEFFVCENITPMAVAGFCYTQLTDVEQERNGLLTSDRRPKVDPRAVAAVHRRLFSGVGPGGE